VKGQALKRGDQVPQLKTDSARLLELVPMHNAAIRIETSPDGLVVWVPIAQPFWMRSLLRFVLPFRKEKGIALDVIGREVFEACDGNRNVEAIIEQFAKRHKIRFFDARQSVTTFLRWLLERKIIILVLGPMEQV